MKIIHTADWHLGNVFHRHDRSEEHRYFLDWLLQTLKQEQPDALFVAGDIFDTSNPPASSVRQFYDFLLRATTVVEGLQIVVVAGNHDGAARLEAPASLFALHRITVRGTVQRDENGAIDFSRHFIPLYNRTSDTVEALCLAVPYLRSADYPAGGNAQEGTTAFFKSLQLVARQSRYANVPMVGVAHFYATGAEISEDEHSERLVVGGQDCVNVETLSRGLSYVALGHIHKAQRVAGQEEIRYSGSPIALSFSEKNYRRSVVCVELDATGKAAIRQIPFDPLRQLVSIPSVGDASAAEVIAAIKKLPKPRKDDDAASWPYLELRVRQEEPDPALQNVLMEELADKAVYYCRTVRVSHEAKMNDDEPKSLNDLQQLAPIDMAKQFYQQRYSGEMPESMEKLFNQVIHELAIEGKKD